MGELLCVATWMAMIMIICRIIEKGLKNDY